MQAVIWNVLIILSILASYKYSKKVGIGFTIFWGIWTITMLWGELQIIQLIGVGISSYIGFNFTNRISKQEKTINELEGKIKDFQKDKTRVDNENLNKSIKDFSTHDMEVIDSNPKHREYLFKALNEANQQIIILSGWANSYVLNYDFREKLKNALNRGVHIYIGYGYKSHGQTVLKEHEKKAKNDLKDLQDWCATQDTKGELFVNYYPNHSKILINDYQFAINGSFNWLSNSGGAENEERSWVVYNKKFIESESELIIDKIQATRRDFFKKIYPFKH